MRLVRSHARVLKGKQKVGVALLLLLWFTVLAPQSLFGQADTGRITGTVTDSTGGVIPGAQVTITALGTNRSGTFVTDAAGRYSSGPLQPGEYRLEAESPGFKRVIRDRISLEVQETAVVDFQLDVGDITEQVTVTAAQDLIETTEASQGQVIEQRRVHDLPLNGRDYVQLSLLSEGAMEPPGQGRTATGENSGTGSRAGGFSAGAQRTTANNYLVDGFNNNTDDTSFDNNQGEAVKPSVDAVREFKVQTNAYSAEFGRAAGGVVNLTLNSGTNRFHGTVYEFLRNEELDARNFFDGEDVSPFKRNDYGFTVGGPVIKNRAFFFFSHERLYRRESLTVNNTILTLEIRRGDFSQLDSPIFDPATFDGTTGARDPFPNNIIPESRFDPVAQQLIDFYPAPDNARLSQNSLFNPPDQEDVERLNTREDLLPSQKDHISWRLNTQMNDIPASPALPGPGFGGNTRTTDVRGYNTGLSWTRTISPSVVTTTKIGWTSTEFLIDLSPEAKALGDVAGEIGLPTPQADLPVKFPTISHYCPAISPAMSVG